MTSLKTSIKTITYLSDTGCLEIQGASLEILYSLKNKYCIKLLSAQDRAFIYEFAKMIFAYINDRSLEVTLLSCFAETDQTRIQRYIPQPQDAEKFWNNLQYKVTLPIH